MNAARPDIALGCPTQAQLDWLLRSGVTIDALIQPSIMQTALGARAHDGRFECLASGPTWMAFEEAEDWVLWQPRTGEIATYEGRAFALGEDNISNPGTFMFDCCLNIFADPFDWLRAKRDGIVVLDWCRAFDRLRDCPRVSVAEELLPEYLRHMKPSRMPEVFVMPSRKAAA